MRKRDVRTAKYILVLALTIMVFVFGLLLGNYLTEKKVQSVSEIEENLRLQTAGAELQYLLLLEEPCKYINSTPLTEELYSISEKVDYMETQRGERDPDVKRLKNQYSILQVRHLIFTLRTNEQCDLNQVPLLYFYSNEGDCPSCKEQGYTLTYLRRKYPELRVYAFDVNIDNPALDTLKEIHGITEAPTIVLPHDRLGFTSSDDLELILQQNYSLTPQ